ncbi:RING-H2 finger protein ATL2 [Cornus florida]|uniref:RING-H2 finger protein ATL2 n=1 Tax=Cornus florida TaxID=4283 RepID=UPI0028A2D3DF|nr:RING-H2 finger protein ATL2 [Cornus florida]
MSATQVMDSDGRDDRFYQGSPPKGYALSGKIMLSAIVILFAVVVFVVCLHIYARWYLLRARRRNLRRRRTAHLVFYVDPNNPNATTVIAPGLDASVLSTLPVFAYSSKTHPEVLECAVCLSEFEENEKGRLLPKCNHSFHIGCIDMWFHSHSTCPLCRSPVEPQVSAPVDENRCDVVVTIDEPAGSSAGLCSTCQHEEEVTSLPSSSSSATSALGARRKGLDLTSVTIEIPRNDSDIELAVSSPASRGFKSPVTRFLRILSMNRRSPAFSPASGVGTSCGGVGTELDIERGVDESTQQKSGSAAEIRDGNSNATTV